MKNVKLTDAIDNTMVTIEQAIDLVQINDDMVEDLIMSRGELRELKAGDAEDLDTKIFFNRLDDKLNKMISTHDIIVKLLNDSNFELNNAYINDNKRAE